MIIRCPTGAEVHEILCQAHAGTYRPLLSWAVAVLESSHAMYPLMLWRTGTPEALCPGEGGRSLDRGRWLDHNRSGVIIRDGELRKPLTVAWADLAAVFYARILSQVAIEPCRRAMERRVAHTPPRSDTDWAAIEGECYRAGLAIWQACRPADQGEQLDLFAADSIALGL